MRVALIHDWLTGMRGGEKCLEALCELFPDADLFTLVRKPDRLSPQLRSVPTTTSFLQRLPGATRWYRYYLPLMPLAVEQLDLQSYDLVISSSHAVAKGVIVRPGALHICYCHTPMRYTWDASEHYLRESSLAVRAVMLPLLHYLRLWDVASAARVDQFIANSTFCARRIRRYYRRSARVIHPPVDTDFFAVDRTTKDHYLIVSALVPYKRVDLAIEAFTATGRPLKIVGEGPMYRRLAANAGPSIEFTGWIPSEGLRELYASCRALIMPGVEDCGIAPLEANATGRPVIAMGRGGVLDTVVPLAGFGQAQRGAVHAASAEKATGVFFEQATALSLNAAIDTFERNESAFRGDVLRDHARGFDRSVFKKSIADFVRTVIEARETRPVPVYRAATIP